MDKRRGRVKWGPHGTRSRTSEDYWDLPKRWNRYAHRFNVRLRVFCASLADVFEDWQGDIVDARGQKLFRPSAGFDDSLTMDHLRRDLFALIDATPHLDWLILTKRPENIRRMWPENRHTITANDNQRHTFRPNCWLGTSIMKIDGEFNLLVYQGEQAILVNPGGTVRAGLPFLRRLADYCCRALALSGMEDRIVLAGEFSYERPGDRSRVHDIARVARNPQSEEDLERLDFWAFDVIGMPSFTEAWEFLGRYQLHTPAWCRSKDLNEIRSHFDMWVIDGRMEGMVLRSDQGSYKVKQRHSIDAVVVGFTEGTGDRAGMIHDLLLALFRPDGTYQLIGRVGGGFTDQDRRDWLCDLQDWCVGSDHTEINDGLAYRWVWPKHVIEISVLDVLSQTTRSQPILTQCLDWQSAEGLGFWRAVRKLPGVALISPQFVRRREDKATGFDVRISQVADLVEIPLIDQDPRTMKLAASQVLRRAVWIKHVKGQRMVRKMVLWQTNKATPLVPGALPDWPAYALAYTDYSPGRAEPLQRELRVSDSREQIEKLWTELQTEKVVKGWNLVSDQETFGEAG